MQGLKFNSLFDSSTVLEGKRLVQFIWYINKTPVQIETEKGETLWKSYISNMMKTSI